MRELGGSSPTPSHERNPGQNRAQPPPTLVRGCNATHLIDGKAAAARSSEQRNQCRPKLTPMRVAKGATISPARPPHVVLISLFPPGRLRTVVTRGRPSCAFSRYTQPPAPLERAPRARLSSFTRPSRDPFQTRKERSPTERETSRPECSLCDPPSLAGVSYVRSPHLNGVFSTELKRVFASLALRSGRLGSAGCVAPRVLRSRPSQHAIVAGWHIHCRVDWVAELCHSLQVRRRRCCQRQGVLCSEGAGRRGSVRQCRLGQSQQPPHSAYTQTHTHTCIHPAPCRS